MDRGEWENLARVPRLPPLLLFKRHPGMFLCLGPTSHPKDGAFRTIQYPRHGALGPTQTAG